MSYFFIDNELPTPKTPEELKGFCGYGIRCHSTGRWYAGAGRFSNRPDSRDKRGYAGESLWPTVKAARRSVAYSLRSSEIALLEAVPLYSKPPDDFVEWVEGDRWEGPYAAGTPMPLG